MLRATVGEVTRRSGIGKRATSRASRHSFAPHPPEVRYDIRKVPELSGHTGVQTMINDTLVLNQRGPSGLLQLAILHKATGEPERARALIERVAENSPTWEERTTAVREWVCS